MKYEDLTESQQAFVEKKIIQIFGKMPSTSENIVISDWNGIEARYEGLVIRPESIFEYEKRWRLEN